MEKVQIYSLSNMPKLKQAQIIDEINQWCIKSYFSDCEEDPTPNNIWNYFSEKHGIHSKVTELLLRLMIHEGYLNQIVAQNDNSIVECFEHTSKGLSLYFSGGVESKIRTETRKNRLITVGHIAAIIVGVYYLIEIAKVLYKVVCL